MALNPIAYTEKVVGSFLRYQLSAYPFADVDLYAQLRRLLSLEQTRNTPLLRGPYLSLSRSFARGAAMSDLVRAGIVHEGLTRIAPHPHLHAHQEKALRAIKSGHSTLVSTGTGSGKTECFLYPIIDHCLRLRDTKAPPGIAAVLVYPMNALAEDQLLRLRLMLAGTGITFGMYVGKTPESRSAVVGTRLDVHASRADYEATVAQERTGSHPLAVHPYEERCSREELRAPGEQPRILLTNVKQLELLLTRQADVELFEGARLEYMVFDEAHTFSGAQGAETACLIRRLRAFCGRTTSETVCVATSATLADPSRREESGRVFAGRFFGVDPASVVVVGEEHESQTWDAPRKSSPAPSDPVAMLREVLSAVDGGTGAGQAVAHAAASLSVQGVDPARWEASLYERLSEQQVVYEIAQNLHRPRALRDVIADVGKNIGREITEEEILGWLALGAAARQEERPLLRPVVHGFVRGISGAVVRFPSTQPRPELWLAAEDAAKADAATDAATANEPKPFHVLTCTTCGQHYFEHFVEDLSWVDEAPTGGISIERGALWRPLGAKSGGTRVVFFDHLISADDDEEGPGHTASMHLCRYCGALHDQPHERCAECSRPDALVAVSIAAEKDREDRRAPSGRLARCLSCGAMGGQRGAVYREPCRPVKAVTVSDVYVLAQDMVRFAERRRLLVFTDNRQDAAFQAGWMRDHARRFRLRAIMAEQLASRPLSVGDLTAALDATLEADDNLSRSLAPEVWNQYRKESAGLKHAEERKRFLRIQTLREITVGAKQRVGLEPWGRLRIEYLGLVSDRPFVKHWAVALGMTPGVLVDGIASLLDRMRRGFHLLDREGRIFSRFWSESDPEILNGYLPMLDGVPRGIKLQRKATDEASRLTQMLSVRGDTTVRQAARTWGVPKDDIARFVSDLWDFLVGDAHLLAPVQLTGHRGKPLPGCSGAHQIDADRLLLHANVGLWRCRKCRRAQVRAAPGDHCLAWRCDGTLVFQQETGDDYDLALLDSRTEMIRPREHSAQVPAGEREQLERWFKDEHSDAVNALVCTATLEMGVDIGGLDAVLLRNVPPLPSNYWQRAGRAGRRHRMAVTLTYARPASHDRAYFLDPARMLEGVVEPPRFNLRNELMIGKHVHATVLTRLRQLANHAALASEADRASITATLDEVFPVRVTPYLFEVNGQLRSSAFSVAPLGELVRRHEGDLMTAVKMAFQQGWPPEDRDAIAEDKLLGHVQKMTTELDAVISRLRKRLDWALSQMLRLNATRVQRGTLDPEDDAIFRRCDLLVKRYKGQKKRARQQAEGFDDINTFGVLAAEGFLPGYGLETGAIVGTAQVPNHLPDSLDFELSRPPSLALREYVPGNLIYANGHRFVARQFRLEAIDNVPMYQVDVAKQAIAEAGAVSAAGSSVANTAALGVSYLKAVPICDVELPHVSVICDDEDYRFQMPVIVLGFERGEHEEGQAYRWGSRDVLFRRGVRFRLVNVGAKDMAARTVLGYPVCTGCGQSRSPFASKTELEKFREMHRAHVGSDVENVGFFADVTADALKIPGCASREEAYSIAETFRIGASQILDMEREDLDVLVTGVPGSDACDAIVYDPMPGGSGLLEQLCGRFAEVIEAGRKVAEECPSRCDRACVDCLLTFRNGFFHEYLDRHLVIDRLHAWGPSMEPSHAIVSRFATPAPSGERTPHSHAEQKFRRMLVAAAFPEPEWQKPIDLGRVYGTTRPDAFFPDDDPDAPGLCIYVDGLSAAIHGNAARQRVDIEIREVLRSRGFDVFAISATDLDDVGAMKTFFYRIARKLMRREDADRIRDQATWFDSRDVPPAPSDEPPAANPPVDAWAEVFTFLPIELHALAQALRDAAIDAPEVDVDLMDGDCVSYARASMLWRRAPGDIALVADGVRPPEGAKGTYLSIIKDKPPRELAETLLALLRVRP